MTVNWSMEKGGVLMRDNIIKACEMIKEGDFKPLEYVGDFTEDEQALIDAVLYLEGIYCIETVWKLQQEVFDLTMANKDLNHYNESLLQELRNAR